MLVKFLFPLFIIPRTQIHSFALGLVVNAFMGATRTVAFNNLRSVYGIDLKDSVESIELARKKLKNFSTYQQALLLLLDLKIKDL